MNHSQPGFHTPNPSSDQSTSDACSYSRVYCQILFQSLLRCKCGHEFLQREPLKYVPKALCHALYLWTLISTFLIHCDAIPTRCFFYSFASALLPPVDSPCNSTSLTSSSTIPYQQNTHCAKIRITFLHTFAKMSANSILHTICAVDLTFFSLKY